MNLGILRSLIRGGQMVSTKSFRPRQFHKTSSALLPPSKPSPDNNESNPFGINDDKDLNSLLVQGNLKSEESPIRKEEQDVESRLKKYESWIKQSEDKRNALEDKESIIVSSYGKVRLDKDNVPAKEGYYYENSGENEYEVSAYNKNAKRSEEGAYEVIQYNKNTNRSRKNYVHPEEEDSQKRMTAHEFLKTHKSEQKEITKAVNKNKRVEREPASKDYSINSPIENPADYDFLDSNEVPKQYILPNLNHLTHEDMWNVLKKSIIFENEFMMAINKPYGIAFQGKSRDCHHTIMQFMKEFAEHCKCPAIFPVHRIDKDATGVLLFAKESRVANVISQKFSKRQVRKLYITVTKNCPHVPQGTIKIPIGEGKIGGTGNYRSVLKPDLIEYNIKNKQTSCKEATTKFNVIKSAKEYAFLEVEPESGLKHQIRVHLGLGLGCPVLGDHKYSHRDRLAPQRLPTIMLKKLKIKQTKVRELPMHLHCSQISFDLSSEFTESKEPLFIHAKVPFFFNHTLKSLGLARNRK